MAKKINDLAWFINFMWADFEKLTEGELAKYAVELGLITLGRPIAGPDTRCHGEKVAEASEAALFNYGKGDAGRLRLERLQKALKEKFLEMMCLLQKAMKEGLPIIIADFGFTKIRGTSSEFRLIHSKQKTNTTARITAKARKSESDNNLQYWAKEDLMDAPIQVWESAANEEETIIYNFIRSLNGAKLSQIKQCPECERYFFHDTKREKVFCSNLCAARKNSRDRRARMKEEEPDKYRAVMRSNTKRARASYEKKVRQENPNVKIGRHPRTKKGS